MTRRADLDLASWELLCRAPLAMWLALCAVDPIVDSPAREAEAFDRALARARERFAQDELLAAVLAEARAPSGAQRRGVVAVDVEAVLRQLEAVRDVLDEQCTVEEAVQFKGLLVEIGTSVARAANESVTGSRIAISQPEERFLYRARRALGWRPSSP